MNNGFIYEIFKVVVGNFSLVLFLVVGVYKLAKKLEMHFLSLQGIEKSLDCVRKQLELMQKRFDEHRERSEKILGLLPKREQD